MYILQAQEILCVGGESKGSSMGDLKALWVMGRR